MPGSSLASVLTDTNPGTFAFSFLNFDDAVASLTLGWSSVSAVKARATTLFYSNLAFRIPGT